MRWRKRNLATSLSREFTEPIMIQSLLINAKWAVHEETRDNGMELDEVKINDCFNDKLIRLW